jgi:hypothetical protein
VHDVDVAEHDDVGFGAVGGEGDEGEDAVGFVVAHGDALDGLEVVADPLDGTTQLVGPLLGSRDEDEVAGEGDEALAETGGVKRSVDDGAVVEGR